MISILLIDDSPEEREFITDLVQDGRHDVSVTQCHGGADGVSCVNQNLFDCVLLDIRLDGEDGLDVLHDLHLARPNLPIIILTGQGSEQAPNKASLAGAAHYLTKRGLTGVTLWAAIDRVIIQGEKERELRAKREALERSNRLDAVGQLAAGIAHDFNNQLGALRYCIEFLKPSAVTADAKDRIRTALKVIDDSKSLAGRLVSLSQQGDLLATAVSLHALFEDLQILAAAAVSSQVKLEIDVPETGLNAYCDQSQLMNALINLVLNAEDAIRVKAAPGTIKIIAKSEGGKAKIIVQDNGRGMTDAVLSKCADPFFTTKQDRNGTGLGLAMVQSFANDNAGDLLLQSTEGEGTTVTIVLPLAAAPKTDSGQPEARKTPIKVGAKVLVVDDQLLLATMTKEIIEEQGYAVEMVYSAEAALQRLETGTQFDLLVTDIKMPGMNGLELAQRVHRQTPGTEIIYVTGYPGKTAYNSKDLLGPVLRKPVAPQVLLEAVESSLI